MRLNGIRWGIIKGMIKDHTNVSREKDLLRVLCEQNEKEAIRPLISMFSNFAKLSFNFNFNLVER